MMIDTNYLFAFAGAVIVSLISALSLRWAVPRSQYVFSRVFYGGVAARLLIFTVAGIGLYQTQIFPFPHTFIAFVFFTILLSFAELPWVCRAGHGSR